MFILSIVIGKRSTNRASGTFQTFSLGLFPVVFAADMKEFLDLENVSGTRVGAHVHHHLRHRLHRILRAKKHPTVNISNTSRNVKWSVQMIDRKSKTLTANTSREDMTTSACSCLPRCTIPKAVGREKSINE